MKLQHEGKRSFFTATIGFALVILATAPMASAADSEGETLFKKHCANCHSLEPGKNRSGPSLADLMGRKAATIDGYRYSKLLRSAGEAGLVWDAEKLEIYLASPKRYLKAFLKEAGKPASGGSKMTFRLKKPEEAKAVTTYLGDF